MRLIILGAGGYGQTIADIARQVGRYSEIAFLDDTKSGNDILGCCADFAHYADAETEMYPAFGNNAGRLAWMDKLTAVGISIPTLVHPTAYISPSAKLSEGVMVLPKALVNTACVIKRGCIVNCGCIIDHGCLLEEGVHVCLGAIVKAENHIPTLTKVEAGEVVQNRTYPL